MIGSGITSLFIWLLADRTLYAIFLGVILVFLNFHVFPQLKRARKMEELFFDRLEKMPLPQDFLSECSRQKDELVVTMEKMLKNSNLQQELTIQKFMAEITDFYARIAAYETYLQKLIDAVGDLGDDISNTYGTIDRDIQTLLNIRTEMVRLIRNLIREAEKNGYIENIDQQPLDRIQTFLDAADKHMAALYAQHSVDRYGMPTDKKLKFNRVFQSFDTEEDENEDEK